MWSTDVWEACGLFPREAWKMTKKRKFCEGYIEISLPEIITGVCTSFSKYLGVHTKKNFKATEIPYLYKELNDFRVPYCCMVNDLTTGPTGARLPWGVLDHKALKHVLNSEHTSIRWSYCLSPYVTALLNEDHGEIKDGRRGLLLSCRQLCRCLIVLYIWKSNDVNITLICSYINMFIFFCFSLFIQRDTQGFRCCWFQALLVANPEGTFIAVAASLGDSL